ncbi:uncharacterized protein BKCO1_980006 [Diplodia corticola]|uniref:Uncharacterized protein n=1 Tax=Diplodia corticola TaxID=236234 RepID=A0A1J9QLQ8_9PEZI|nr:uncharacterized protein BKCO1_980006 [Diplodia corticola]OJD29002.1 hypothetical protein BKCO1_980006 [Diplodia corticola]
MSDNNMQGVEMNEATPSRQTDSGQRTQAPTHLQSSSAITVAAPPPTPTQPVLSAQPATTSFAINPFSETPFPTGLAGNSTSPATAITPIASLQTVSTSSNSSNRATPSPVILRRPGTATIAPWHTWNRLLGIMRRIPGDTSAGIEHIHRLASRTMSLRASSVGTKAVRKAEAAKGHTLQPTERKAVKNAAVARDPFHTQLVEVMGGKGAKHTDEQLDKFVTGRRVTYRCCRCHKVARTNQAGGLVALSGRGEPVCGCGHVLCLICLHVQRMGDELIEFEFMGLDDEDEDGAGSQDGGNGGGMGDADMVMEIEA